MRIFKSKYYIMSKNVKNSIGDWMKKPNISIVTGYKAANEHPYILREFTSALKIEPVVTGERIMFELRDGHIKGYCPVVEDIKNALAFLDANKYSHVDIITNKAV